MKIKTNPSKECLHTEILSKNKSLQKNFFKAKNSTEAIDDKVVIFLQDNTLFPLSRQLIEEFNNSLKPDKEAGLKNLIARAFEEIVLSQEVSLEGVFEDYPALYGVLTSDDLILKLQDEPASIAITDYEVSINPANDKPEITVRVKYDDVPLFLSNPYSEEEVEKPVDVSAMYKFSFAPDNSLYLEDYSHSVDGDVLHYERAFEDIMPQASLDDTTLSPQALEFLANNPEYTAVVTTFEITYLQNTGEDLTQNEQLLEVAKDCAHDAFSKTQTIASDYYTDYTWDNADIEEVKVLSANYFINNDNVYLEVELSVSGEAIALGDYHDTDYYSEPYYDEHKTDFEESTNFAVNVTKWAKNEEQEILYDEEY